MSQTILYVEPENLSVQFVKKMLKFTPYDVVDASTGKSGLLMAQVRMPDLILMELNLPDMEGPDLVASFKAYTMLRHIPIVVYTTNLLYDAYQLCVNAGCVAHLNKPISKTNLLKALQQFLPTSQVY